VNEVDRKTIKILLASLELEVGELADHIGYDKGYVVNVLNGFTKASRGFRRAFGETVASLVLGPHDEMVKDIYPPEPLVELIESRAAAAPSKREFYRELGTNAQAIKNRKSFDGLFVDRVCCALGVHPSAVYGADYDIAEAS
jgi:hypothetical protein